MYIKDSQYIENLLEKLINTPSPSGYCQNVMSLVDEYAKDLGLVLKRTAKGNGLLEIEGSQPESKALLLTGHLDTLGGMVRSIKKNGTLRFTPVGGYMMQSIEGEYCTIHKRKGGSVTGTILTIKPSVHVYSEARTMERVEDKMIIRIDEAVSTKDQVKELGIQAGDYISFDPHYQRTEKGYIKSRHLDDKAGVAVIFAALKYLHDTGKVLRKPLKVMLSTYEEVGHGASYIPGDIDTMLAVDMGAMGDDLNCKESDVSICAKDSSGPYDYGMVTRLGELAQENGLDYVYDIYPHYGSDASAALAAGHDIKAALIGPGVDASHFMERTHERGLLNAANLLIAFLLDEEEK